MPPKSELAKVLRKWSGPFNAEAHLKCRLASFFWTDANDFMWRIDLVQRTDMAHRSFRAKIFVEMLMAAECAFKSIILSLSSTTESPEQAYKLMRDCKHDLSKLAVEAGKRCRRRIAFLDTKELAILQQASGVGVRSRYSVDVFFMLSQEALEDRLFATGKISATLEDDAWMSAFYNVVKRAFIISKRASSIGCDKQRAILGSDSKKVDDRFKQFLKANNIKP